jgi:farnesyl diphosphate synthase
MFQTALGAAQTSIGAFLTDRMSRFGEDPVAQGMRYASDGGKRLRGFLVLESSALFDVAPSRALHAAAAVECLHAYSLVHDDLPCMDDDDLRRGRPTVHRKWDEATAVLVGDALQTFAFELLCDPAAGDADQRVALVASLAKASGAQGMVLGQAQDIAAETAGRPLTLDQITELQRNKTGRLIEWPAEAGAILGRADPARCAPTHAPSASRSRSPTISSMSRVIAARQARRCARTPGRERRPSSRSSALTARRHGQGILSKLPATRLPPMATGRRP